MQHTKEREARIRKQLQGVKLPPSSYDTAWVAMVPLRGSPQAPRFPQCVEWILENQQDNGSWGIYQFDSSVNKGILLSTLACVLALKRWNVGREDIRRGTNKYSLTCQCCFNLLDLQVQDWKGLNSWRYENDADRTKFYWKKFLHCYGCADCRSCRFQHHFCWYA